MRRPLEVLKHLFSVSLSFQKPVITVKARGCIALLSDLKKKYFCFLRRAVSGEMSEQYWPHLAFRTSVCGFGGAFDNSASTTPGKGGGYLGATNARGTVYSMQCDNWK